MVDVIASSANKDEIEHFNKLNKQWWDEGKNKLIVLHALNELRVPYIRDCLYNTLAAKEETFRPELAFRGLTILEVGCGGGILSEALARLGCNIKGVDAAEEVIKVAKNHASLDPKLTNLTYECSTIEDYALKNVEKYDVVVASEVIEHTDKKRIFLEACVKCLKPGGSIFITTMSKTYTAWFMGIFLAEYVFGVIPKGTHEYDKFISPKEVAEMLNEFNCKVVAPAQGMWYNFFRNKWFLTSNDYFCYALQAIKN